MSGTAWLAIGSPTNPPIAPFDGVPVLVSNDTAISIAKFMPAHVTVNATFEMKEIDGTWTVVPEAPSTFPDAWYVMENGLVVMDAAGAPVTVVPTHWQPAPSPT